MTDLVASRPLSIGVHTRLIALVAGIHACLATASVLGSRSPVGGANEGIGGVGPSWFRAWTSYDANWYVTIADEGYRQAPTTAFFPVLPMLMRLMSPAVEFFTGFDHQTGLAASGVAISVLAFICALIVIHAEVRALHGSVIAERTVVVLSALPFALTWQTVYTESLTLLLLALMVRWLRLERTGPAVMAAVTVGATRSIGIPLGIGMVVAHALLPLFRRKPIRWTGAPLVGVTAAMSSATVLLWLGNIGGGVAAQAQFGRARSWPWVPVWRDLIGTGGYQIGSVTSLGAILLGTLYLFARHEPLEWRIMVGVLLMMHLVMARQVPAFTIGAARYLMPLFPVAMWCAQLTERVSRPLLIGVGTVMGALALGCAFGAGQGAFNIG